MKKILWALFVVCLIMGAQAWSNEAAVQKAEFKGAKFSVVSLERQAEYNMTPQNPKPLIFKPNNPGEEFLLIHMNIELIPPTTRVDLERQDVLLIDSSGKSYEFFFKNATAYNSDKDFSFAFCAPIGISLKKLKIGESILDISQFKIK
jgi:hypothetical protein